MTDIVEDLERWSLHPGEMCPACHAIDTPEPGCVCDVAPRAKAEIERLRADNARMRTALTRLRDCDWAISLPDRMDAVRDIARSALENK